MICGEFEREGINMESYSRPQSENGLPKSVVQNLSSKRYALSLSATHR